MILTSDHQAEETLTETWVALLQRKVMETWTVRKMYWRALMGAARIQMLSANFQKDEENSKKLSLKLKTEDWNCRMGVVNATIDVMNFQMVAESSHSWWLSSVLLLS